MGWIDGVDQGMLDLAWGYLPVVLACARVGGFVMVAPLFGPEVDWRFRVVFGAMLAAATAPLATPGIAIPTAWSIPGMVIGEVLSGALVGLPAALLLGAARQAGELVAAGSGYSASAMFDPASGEVLSPLGRLHGLIALAAFLALDGPLRMVSALVASFGSPTQAIDISLVDRLCRILTWALEITLQAAAPAALAMVMASATLAWLARVAPGAGAIVLAPTARMVIGLVVVILFLAVVARTFSDDWRAILGTP